MRAVSSRRPRGKKGDRFGKGGRRGAIAYLMVGARRREREKGRRELALLIVSLSQKRGNRTPQGGDAVLLGSNR